MTIQDIKNIAFRKSLFGGYRSEDVDNFVDSILISYEEMEREKRNLNLVIQKLEREIRKFREEEKSIKEVVSDLKSVIDKSISETEMKAKDIISEASETSKQMVEDAKKEVAIQKKISDNLKKESNRLKKSLDEVYKKHLEIMNSIPYNHINESITDESNRSDFNVSESSNRVDNMLDGRISGGNHSKFHNLEFGDKYRNNLSFDGNNIYDDIFKDSNRKI